MRSASSIFVVVKRAVLIVIALSGTSVAASVRVVKLDIAKQPLSAQRGPQLWHAGIEDRAQFEQDLDHNTKDQAYFATLKIGTPPQKVPLLVDTGSANTWVLDQTATCDEGCNTTFYSQTSSTFDEVDKGGFNVTYTNNDTASGDLFRETIGIGKGNDIIVKDFLMGLAKASKINTGILGVGYSSFSPSDLIRQPPLIDKLKSDGHISARAYSLYLDDLSSNTGSILFGGIDKTKFTGPLWILDDVPNQNNVIEHLRVNLNAITANQSSTGGGVVPLTTGNSSSRVLLDSGTSFTRLPQTNLRHIYEQFQVREDRNHPGIGFIDCAMVEKLKGLTIDFTFGRPGETNPATIMVPFKEFVIDNISNAVLATLPQDLGFSRVCWFGMLNGTFPILGQNFLRSAYMVFDLEHNKIGLAQANVGSSSGGGGEIIEITEKEGIPGGLIGKPSQGGTPTGSGGTGGSSGPANPTSTGQNAGVRPLQDGRIRSSTLVLISTMIFVWFLY